MPAHLLRTNHLTDEQTEEVLLRAPEPDTATLLLLRSLQGQIDGLSARVADLEII